MHSFLNILAIFAKKAYICCDFHAQENVLHHALKANLKT